MRKKRVVLRKTENGNSYVRATENTPWYRDNTRDLELRLKWDLWGDIHRRLAILENTVKQLNEHDIKATA